MCWGLQHPQSSRWVPAQRHTELLSLDPRLWAEPQAGSGADPAEICGCSCSGSAPWDGWWHQPTKCRAAQGGDRNLLEPPQPPACPAAAPSPFPTTPQQPRDQLLSCHRPFLQALEGDPRPLPAPRGEEVGDERALLFAGGGGKPKIAARPNSRKAKSPAPGLSSGERPPSVSSVHSEGDCNRRTPLTNRVWEDRPSSAGRARGGGRVPKAAVPPAQGGSPPWR